jgi:hypothetical protein
LRRRQPAEQAGDLVGSIEHRPGEPTDLAVTIDSVAP